MEVSPWWFYQIDNLCVRSRFSAFFPIESWIQYSWDTTGMPFASYLKSGHRIEDLSLDQLKTVLVVLTAHRSPVEDANFEQAQRSCSLCCQRNTSLLKLYTKLKAKRCLLLLTAMSRPILITDITHLHFNTMNHSLPLIACVVHVQRM